MADTTIDNIYIVNAPAGSGKTTRIKSMVIDHIIENPIDNILCITYTNRAANELLKDLSSANVHVSTIHSFLNHYLSIYFSHQEILNMYFELYSSDIQARIENLDQKDNVDASNARYIEKYGTLDIDTIKQNISRLYYNEISFNSLYYGGLSHDDLISFSESVFSRFTKIRQRLTQKYQAIYIDEYQDSSDYVLKLFYDSVKETTTKLYFLGDKMQQIYTNYQGGFEEELVTLNSTISLTTNHRSLPAIINILNNLYNDTDYIQQPSIRYTDIRPEHEPRVIICENPSNIVSHELSQYPDALCLYLLNQQKFASIGSPNLFQAIKDLDRYSISKKLSPTDILSDSSPENPDQLMCLLYQFSKIHNYFRSNSLGKVLRTLKEHPRIFNSNFATITKHQDKIKMKSTLEKVMLIYESTSNTTCLTNLVDILSEESIINATYTEEDFVTEYKAVLSVNISEFHALHEYISNPNVSTQHGVKGESHDTVFFIADDNKRTPVVHMYQFLQLWSFNDVSLTSFEAFYYEYKKWISETNQKLGFALKDITVAEHDEHKEYLAHRISDLVDYFSDNIYFNYLCRTDHDAYLTNPNKTRVTKCMKESSVYGSLSAYKLFYVGCSRARKNLTIILLKSKVSTFQTELTNKLIATGFLIECK